MSKIKSDLQQKVFSFLNDDLNDWLEELAVNERADMADELVEGLFVEKNIPAILKYCAEVLQL